MANLPTDIVNQALDAIGSPVVIGDIEEGTREAQVALRAYTQCLQQLLRSAHWDFARKMAQLTLLADATGQTEGVGTTVPQPWIYEYAYPQDCVKARFVPMNQVGNLTGGSNYSLPATPLTGVGSPTSNYTGLKPARFVVSTDTNYMPQLTGAYWEIPHISPGGQTVILTNVQNAQLVYTCNTVYPNMWDALFRAALVSYLASELIMAALPNIPVRDRIAIRDSQIRMTKERLQQARITDGNEGWTTTNHTPDWITVRGAGPRGLGYGLATEGIYYGWDNCYFADGSSY